jgi:molecular chaperone DnaJ
MAKRDYYEVLGISREADAEQIKHAYRNLALKHHPDRNPGDKSAEEKFREATEAYEVLSDKEKRATYDRFGHQGLQRDGFDPSQDLGRVYRDSDLGDVFGGFSFEDLFGLFGAAGTRRPAGARSGEATEATVSVTLAEVLHGAKKKVDISRLAPCRACTGTGAAAGSGLAPCPQCGGSGSVRFVQGFFSITRTCERCRGTGQVIEKPCTACSGKGRSREREQLEITIPPGIEHGSRLRVRGKGNAGARGGPAGNLYLGVFVEPDPRFQRAGADINHGIHITFGEAALGAVKSVPTLHGDVRMKIPAGTQSDSVFRLRGKGLPQVSGKGYGDQLVRVRVETPVNLGREERRLLEELEKTAGPRAYPRSKAG